MKLQLWKVFFVVYSFVLSSLSCKLVSRRNVELSRDRDFFDYKGFDFRYSLCENTDDDVLEIASYFRRLETKQSLERQDLSLTAKLNVLRLYEFPLNNLLSDEIRPVSFRKGGLFDDWKRGFEE